MTVSEFKEKFGIIARSKAINDLCDISLQVANSDISILLYGESGVGKEVFARAIHGAGSRFNKPMVNVNCGAIPEGLLESELFGHQKGSFTGAIGDRKGYFEIADGGTLFLDEIAEMPLTTQVKLLRVLETKEFMRIGSENVTKVDVRIIAATNKDLQQEVIAKNFRHDLYFRLKAVSLNIPPLRERKEDIILLAEHFLKKYSDENKIPLPTISAQVSDFLTDYTWPGNIRELKNVIETSVALRKDRTIDLKTVEQLLSLDQFETPNRFLPVYTHKSSESLDREMIFAALIEIKKGLDELRHFANSAQFKNQNNITPVEAEEVKTIKAIERDAIIKALSYTRGNKRRASDLLEISERTLYRKLKEYDIDY